MPQWVERIVQADLNVGTGTLWLKAPGGGEILSTQMGLHSVARGQKAYTSTWAPGAIAAGSKASTTITAPDAEIGDFVMVSHDKILTSDLRISGHINAAGVVRVVIQNPTASSVTVASGTVSILVLTRKPSAAVAMVDGLVTYLGAPAAGAFITVIELPANYLATTTTDANGYYSVVVEEGHTAFTRATYEISPGVFAPVTDSASYTTELYVIVRGDVAIV